jgi:hypothetical protein
MACLVIPISIVSTYDLAQEYPGFLDHKYHKADEVGRKKKELQALHGKDDIARDTDVPAIRSAP